MFPESPQPPSDPAIPEDPEARQQLFAELYNDLRRIAQRALRRHGPGVTLGATTLLHEAYVNISERQRLMFPDRERFLAYASRAMRGLIIDYARNRQALKRGAGFEITAIATDMPELVADCEQLQQLDEAIEKLALVDPGLAQVVDLKYFSGFSFVDIAAMSGVSERTVQRQWEKARVFLYRAIESSEGDKKLKL